MFTSRDRRKDDRGRAQPLAIMDAANGGFNIAAHGLRGLASVLVVFAHIIGGTAEHIYPHRADYVRFVAHPWYLGTFGVEIFFVISGFVILPSALRYKATEFAARRFIRIYPLFLMLSLIFVALNARTNSYPRINNIESIASGLLFLNLFTGTEQLTPNAWSLSFEVWFYILTGWLVAAGAGARQRPAFIVAGLVAAAFVVAFPISTYFMIGLILSLSGCARRMATQMTRFGEAISLVALAWCASRAHFDYTSWWQFMNATVPAILVSISCYFSFALQRRSLTAMLLGGKVFRYIGDVSYSLYLVHPFVYYLLRYAFVRLGWFTNDIALSITAFAAAVFAGSFVLTHVVHVLFERWPYQAVFHQGVFRVRTIPASTAVSTAAA